MTMASNIITRWIDDVVASLRKCGSRFPAAVFFIVALTAWCMFLNHENGLDDEQLINALTYYLSVGIPLSMMLQLWSEEMTCRIRRIATHVIGQLLLLADAIYLYMAANISLATGIAHAAIIAAIVVAIFLISFFKWKDDIPCWNFAMRSAISYIKATVTGMLLNGGIELLIMSIGILFDIDISTEIYLDVTIICNICLTCVLFIGMLPSGTHKHDSLPHTNGFLNTLVRYVFIPLTAAYMLVLYAYAIRIVFMWELPNGWVSWLVTALMASCIIIETGLYPFRQFPVKKKADELIARWLPMFIMPLLVLMTIGIIRRFNDYGITVMRLYLITFNLWCYAVCITLFLTRARRISWIPASFAAIFLLTSIIPKFNFADITLDTLRRDIVTTMEQTCTDTPPLSEDQYSNWINNTLTHDEGQRINDKLIYLYDMYDERDYNHLVSDSIYFYSYKTYETDTIETDSEGYYGFYATLRDGLDIPNGATRITEVQLFGYGETQLVFHKNEQLSVGLNDKDTIYIDFSTLEELNDNDENAPYTCLQQNNDEFKFVLTSITGHVWSDNDSVNIAEIDGYLFQLNNITK